ncbi:hypothetical protein EDC96DRAFT_591520 [Choanephora cucurbitarum]|nr:hypothetical protein EDC96DRAFT_591520 [Choanephora cucurbitarum]
MKHTLKVKKRKGIYQRNLDVTKWRRSKEAESVDSKQKLTSFGITVTKKIRKLCCLKSYQIHSDQSRTKLWKAVPTLCDFYRYLSVKLYFSKRLQGMNKGSSAREAVKYYWPDNNEKYRSATIIQWATQFIEEGLISEHQQRKAHQKTILLE